MSKTGDKFNFLRDRKRAVEETETETEVETLPGEPAEPATVLPKPEVKADLQSRFEQPKKMGRPRGKRSDPDYEQVTAYIRRNTYTATKIALLQENQGREFSELVEDLLSEYLGTQKSNNSKV